MSRCADHVGEVHPPRCAACDAEERPEVSEADIEWATPVESAGRPS